MFSPVDDGGCERESDRDEPRAPAGLGLGLVGAAAGAPGLGAGVNLANAVGLGKTEETCSQYLSCDLCKYKLRLSFAPKLERYIRTIIRI